MMFAFIAFVSVVSAVLIGAHYLVLLSFLRAFSLSAPFFKYVALALSFLLPLGFFAASALAHFWENAVARGLYSLFAFWMGAFVNILLAAALFFVIVFAAKSAGFGISRPVLAGILLMLALAVSVYGVWNAFHPVIKRISVAVPGLPESWKGKTIVHLSDIHLGPVYRADFLQDVVDRTNTLDPAAVMITGDLFDGMDGDLASLTAPLGDIRSEYGSFFVTGNHETYLGVERSLAALGGSGIRVLDDRAVVEDGLAIVGIGFPERGVEKDIPAVAASLVKGVGGVPSILLYHAPTDIDRMKGTGIALQLSGHTHRGQQFPFQIITRLVHKGYDYGLYDLGGYSLHTSSGVGTWGPMLRIGTRSEIVAITLR